MTERNERLHLSIVALPDSLLWPVSGLYETLGAFELLGGFYHAVPAEPPFQVEIVAPTRTLNNTSSGLPFTAHRTLDEVEHTDIAIVPAMNRPLEKAAARPQARDYEIRTAATPTA